LKFQGRTSNPNFNFKKKMDGDEEDDDVKNQHILFFPIQQATTTGRKGKTSTIHVITTHNKQ